MSFASRLRSASGGESRVFVAQPPTGRVRVKQSALDAGCVLFTLPGVDDTVDVVRDYANNAPCVIQNGTQTSRTTNAFVTTPTGKAIQFHPSGADGAFGSVGYPSSLLSDDDAVTAYWAGYLDNNYENALMFSRGYDGAGNGWSLQLGVFSNNGYPRAVASYVDNPTTAQYDAVLPLDAPFPMNTRLVAGLRKSGNTVEVFFGPTRQTASKTGGNGSMRSSTCGPSLATTSTTDYWPKRVGGHLRAEAFAVYRGAHPTATVWSHIDNIYQDLEEL